MKKIATLFLFALAFTGAFAQKAHLEGQSLGTSTITPNTTRIEYTFMIPLSFVDPASGGLGCDLALYQAQGGGFVVGTNGYGDLQKMMMYDTELYWEGPLTDNPKVDSIYVWFGAKSVGANPGDVTAVVYSGNETDGPNDLLGTSEPVSMNSVDTGVSAIFTGFAFTTPVPVSGKFFAGFSVSTNAGDTVGAVSTFDACYEYSGYAWEMWSDGSFHQFVDPNNWGLDVDLAIFPLVETGGEVGIQTTGDIALNAASPNPAFDVITLNYLVKRSADVRINVYDVTGQLVKSIDNGKMVAGVNKQTLDVSNLNNGLYLYEIVSGAGKVNGNFIVGR
jgi:hypothetical protein